MSKVGKVSKVAVISAATFLTFLIGNNVQASEVNHQELTKEHNIDINSVWDGFDRGELYKSATNDIVSSNNDGGDLITPFSFKLIATGSIGLTSNSTKVTATAKTTGKTTFVGITSTASMKLSGMGTITSSTARGAGKNTVTATISNNKSSSKKSYEAIGVHTASDISGFYQISTYTTGSH